MSADDIGDIWTRALDAMEKLPRDMLLSIIRKGIPYIFGEGAQVLEPDDLGSPRNAPDFIVKVMGNDFAIIKLWDRAQNTIGRVEAAANRLKNYSKSFREVHPTADVSLVLIAVGALSASTIDHLMELGVDRVIVGDDVRRMLAAGVNALGDSPEFSGAEARSNAVPAPTAERFVQLLESVKPGRPAWAQYQKLAGNILEFLFCPRLAKPIPELSNQTQTNRRDFIFPNYAVNGYWASLRTHYAAHFVVVDAKNFKGKVGKSEILQIANYLSDHGAGLFGLIVSRNGGKRDAEITQREQWIMYRKMIVILDDSDMKQMLAIRSSGGDPADLIRQKIEDFRLSF